MIRRHSCALALFLVPCACVGSPSALADPTPPGLYFHAFTGAATGTEWSTWIDLGAPGRFEFSDLSAAGSYPATVSASGSITLDGGVGTGTFHPDGTATINFKFSPFVQFTSQIHRAPGTDAGFPVFIVSPGEGDASLTGPWDATIRSVDPSTGATLTESTGVVDVVVSGTTVRLALPDGSFYQGVWASGERAGVRVISPPPADPRFRTFEGSATSASEDVVGEIRVVGADAIVASMFLQSHAPLGQQVQTAWHLVLSRAPAPLCAGDLSGDGFTTIADFNILASRFGETVTPSTSGDLNADGLVTVADFNILAGDFGCAQ